MHGKELRLEKFSICVFSEKSKVRRASVWLAKWKYFERFIIVCILLNSLVLARKDYTHVYDKSVDTSWNQKLEKVDMAFSLVFIIECLIKLIAYGFWQHKNSYLRSGWNVLDFIIVNISIVGFIFDGGSELKAIRTMRVLRPLRTIS